MYIAFSGQTCLFLSIGLLFLLTVAAIFFGKTSCIARLKGNEVLTKSTVFGLRPTLLNIGFAASLAFVILALGWTKYNSGKWEPDRLFLHHNEEVMVSPPPIYTPPPPPPLPPPATEILPDDELEDAVVFESIDIGAETPVSVSPASVEAVTAEALPPPRPIVEENNAIVVRSEIQPSFPGCEAIGDNREREHCSDQKLLSFIYRNIRYPATAREIGIEGTVVVRFVVEKDGSISRVEVLRDPGGGLGAEAVRVVKLMPLWHPGRQQGRPVRVQFNLPVKFKLE